VKRSLPERVADVLLACVLGALLAMLIFHELARST
jgi:uncharacterized membrane protein YccC